MAKKYTSPNPSTKACLCEDGTYSKECCKGELINQGVGDTKSQSISNVVNVAEVRTINTSN